MLVAEADQILPARDSGGDGAVVLQDSRYKDTRKRFMCDTCEVADWRSPALPPVFSDFLHLQRGERRGGVERESE